MTGQVSPNSDARLKENIRSLDGADVLRRLLRIAPRRYTFRREASAMGKGLSAGEHYGVLAQEVEAEFPLLVKEVPVLSGPSLAGGNGTGAGAEPAPTYKAVTYVEMIPLLLRALQEQQGQIEAQREQSAALRSALAAAGIRVGQ